MMKPVFRVEFKFTTSLIGASLFYLTTCASNFDLIDISRALPLCVPRMSRLKRQRLNADGKDKVTASNNDAGIVRAEGEPENVDDKPIKGQPGRSLFVRSLPPSATTESLTTFFSQNFPLKHATVVVDPSTKKSKGYGFVTFADVQDAQSAKETFNRSTFDGQKIKVELAEPRHRQGGENGSIDATTKKSKPSRQKTEFQQPPKLIVRNLPWTIKDPDQLAILFRSYGKVKHATMPNKKPGLSAGFGFVVLRGRKNAENALKGVNGKLVDGRTLAVDWAVEKEVWENAQNESLKPEVEGSVSDQSAEHQDAESLESVDSSDLQAEGELQDDVNAADSEETDGNSDEDLGAEEHLVPKNSDGNSLTVFVRNLPFTCTDETLQDHFRQFGAVRYARVVLDSATERSKGTGFVCFFKPEDADSCLREAPQHQPPVGLPDKVGNTTLTGKSLLEDTSKDLSGRYTFDGRVVQVSRAVDRKEATRLTYAGSNLRDERDKDKRRLYLLSEGTVPTDSPLYDVLSATEIRMREDSARQRQSLIRSNPTLHLSLTRLSVRNLPRNITAKDLKALAREAVVNFAKDVKSGVRRQLSKEETSRGGQEVREAEKARKAKGKGIVKQAKVVYEGREGGKVAEESGAGRSRGYGFIEYSSHRWALMGLRWLNGHAVNPSKGTATGMDVQERKKRLIVEFAIENAQVVGRRHEREAKARERSKLISEKRERGEITTPNPKTLSRDQVMARTRKGGKRKRAPISDVPDKPNATATQASTNEADKASKRQQIIGRKRMMRRSRNKPTG